MKTQIQFETWWQTVGLRIRGDQFKAVAESAWDAALASADEEPENNPKRIGVEILERVNREADFMAREDGGNVDEFYVAKAVEKLIQELRS